ncbi:MAG: toll/interleukin-1 receptor domain-containing protein, partial [Chloroflexota bacterium]
MDKAFVEQVATQLGRGQVVFDRYSFQPGEDFRAAIRKGVPTSLFVLFVSSNSLESNWVHFEIDEAEWNWIDQNLAGVVAFVIDDRVSHHGIPAWLRRALVGTYTNPKQVARVLVGRIAQAAGIVQQKPFAGRENDLRNL